MSTAVAVLVGAVIGAFVVGIAVVLVMRRSMVVPERSPRSFEDTCAAVEAAVEAADGWSFPMPALDMHAKLAAKNVAPDNLRKIRLYFVCAPAIARRVLSDSPRMSAIMPCSWSVYEQSDGSVWVSKMNIPLMAKMFSGEVKRAMGEVGAADERFMAEILQR